MGLFDFVSKKEDFTGGKYPELNDILNDVFNQNPKKHAKGFERLILYKQEADVKLVQQKAIYSKSDKSDRMIWAFQTAMITTQLESTADRFVIIIKNLDNLIQKNDPLALEAAQLKDIIVASLPDMLNILGDTYNIMNKYEQGLIHYNRTLEIKPNDWKALNGKGEIYMCQGHYADALVCFDNALLNNSESPEIKNNRIAVLDKLQKKDQFV